MKREKSCNSTSHQDYSAHQIQQTAVGPASAHASFNNGNNKTASYFHSHEDNQVLSRPKRFIQVVIEWLVRTLAEGVIGWAIGEAFSGPDKTTLKAIEKNYEAINRNYEAIKNVQKSVVMNTILLVDIYAVVSETRQLVEKMMLQMQENFNRVLQSLNDMRVAPLATGINNFIDYFVSGKEMVSQFSDDEYLAKMRQQKDFLKYLKESRSPKGDSLRSSLYAILHQNLAIPRDSSDSAAFSALQALYYGAQTYASVMLFLMEQYTRLAELCYRNGDLKGFNDNMDALWTHFKSFQQSLIGDKGEDSLLGNVIRVLGVVRNKKFIPKRGESSYKVLSGQVHSLSQLKAQLGRLNLPIILDVPGKISGRPFFPEPGVSTPLGDWKDGATVRYAVQYRSNNTYSKVGEWSTPITVSKKANPTLEIPVDPQRRERLVFRQFNNENPQLVGVLDDKYETKFKDIDRDLFNAALNFDGDTAVREAEILIQNGANINTVFENGRGMLYAAAQSDNVRLARDFLIRANSSGLDVRDTWGYTPLHVAAEAGSSGFTKLLVEQGADVNAQTFAERLTPLHIAAYAGFDSTVAALLKSEAIEVNARDANGFTPLHSAVFGGDKVLRTLMSHNGTDLNAESDAGMTPFLLASINNFVDIAESLMQGDSLDVSAGAAGNLTALHFASMVGNVEMVKLLAGLSSVDVNAVSVLGWTPLHFAVSFKNEEIALELLKSSRTVPDSTGRNGITPLHVAAMTGQTDFLNSLRKKGVDAGKKTEDGKTALHFAAMHGSVGTISAALAMGIDVNSNTLEGLTPLHLAAASPFSSLESVQFLVYKGANLSHLPNSNETCLHLAASGGVLDVIKYFVDKGVNINAQDSSGRRPLHRAAGGGHLEAVQYLAETGAIGGETRNHQTLLHFAASSGHLGVVRTVAPNSTDVNCKDMSGYTPLLVAFRSNHTDVVKYLVEAENADVSVKFDGGETLLHFASSAGDLDLVDVFVRNGADCCARNDGGSTPLMSAAKSDRLKVVRYLTDETKIDLESVCNFLARPVAAYHGHLDVVKHLGSRQSSGGVLILDHFLSLLVAIENEHLDVIDYLLQEEMHSPVSGSKIVWLSSKNIPFNEIATKNFDGTELSRLSGFLALFSTNFEQFEIDMKLAYSFMALAAANHNNVSNIIIDKKIADASFNFNGLTLLQEATSNGFLNLVQYLIESKHVDLEVENDKGMTPLLIAAQLDHFDIVQYLVDRGAKLISSNRISSLFFPAANGNLRMCEYLLMKGCDINVTRSGFESDINFLIKEIPSPKTSFEGNALLNAVTYGHLNVVRFLAGKGANVNANYDGDVTPLQVASRYGYLDVVKYLVEECKADVDVKDKFGDTSFDNAVKGGHLDVLEYLDRKISNSSAYSRSFEKNPALTSLSYLGVFKYLTERGFSFSETLLTEAAQRGNLEVIKYLIKNGASVNYRDQGFFSFDRTALHYSADNGHLDVVKYLVEEKKADVNVQDSYRWTPVHYAARSGHLNVTEYLVSERKADPDIEGTDNETPLLTALLKGHKNVAEFFVEKARVSCRHHKLDECLKGAIKCRMPNFAKELVKSGANATQCLEDAFSSNQFDIAKFLIEKGANAQTKFSSNRTPLHFAAEKGNLTMFQFLLGKGAVVDVEDDDKVTPFLLVKMFCNTAVVDFIEGSRLRHSKRRKILHYDHFLLKSPVFDFSENGRLVEKSRNLTSDESLPSKTPGGSFVGGGQTAIKPGKPSPFIMDQPTASEPDEDEHLSRKIVIKRSLPIPNTLVDSSGVVSGHTVSGCSRPTSWINTLSHAVLDAFMGLSRFVSSPLQFSIAAEQPAAPKEAAPALDTDPQGTLFLLDVLVRRWTGQKYIGTAGQVMSPSEVAKRSADITGNFLRVLRQAAASSGISPHRMDVDVAQAMSVIGRKMMGGNFKDIAGELRSLVFEACPGLEAGCPGRLSSGKFEMFMDEVDKGLETILNQAMMEMVQSVNRRSKVSKMKRQMEAVKREGYIEHSSIRLPVSQAGNDGKKELL